MTVINMLKSYILAYFICNLSFYLGLVKGVNEETEADIRKKLLADYDPSLSPVLFSNSDYYSFINFRVFRIRGLDEKKGVFIVEGMMIMAWIDERLSWENDKIDEVWVSTKDIWTPSIYVYNGIEPEEMTLEPSPIVIQKGVLWSPRYTIRTSCIPNLRYYPFDKNVCDIMITSRGKEGDFISTNQSSRAVFYRSFLQTSFMLNNSQWRQDRPKIYLKKMNIDSSIKRDVIVYRFTIQRSMPLIPLGLLTPCLTCALLLLTTFWMQAGSTLRAGLCVTSMLVSSSSLFTLGKILPASGSSTPIIVEYISITLIFSAISSIQTTVTSVLRRCEKLPPVSYTTIISKIPPWCLHLLCIVPEKILCQQLDQKFLFSELDEHENRNAYEQEDSRINVEQNPEPLLVQSLWLKYIILFDRIMFYVLGLIFLLFIISVIMIE